MNAKATLSKWLANDGNLDRTLRALEFLQNRHQSASNSDLVLQKSRLILLQNQQSMGVLSEESYRIELARIRVAVLDLIDKLPEDWPADGLKTIETATFTRRFNWEKWTTIALLFLAIMVGLAVIPGFPLYDFFFKPVKTPIEKPEAMPLPAQIKSAKSESLTNQKAKTNKQVSPSKKEVDLKVDGNIENSTIIIGNDNQVKQ